MYWGKGLVSITQVQPFFPGLDGARGRENFGWKVREFLPVFFIFPGPEKFLKLFWRGLNFFENLLPDFFTKFFLRINE